MKNFLALLSIGTFLFLMILSGAKRTNDLAINPNLFPWFVGAGVFVIVISILVIIFKRR